MLHSAQRKRTQCRKRLQITSEDGWTHVTNNGNARRTQRKAVSTPIPVSHLPAEAPRDLTFENLKAQFATHRTRWEGSAAWRVVQEALRVRMARTDETISTIVCIGLGSPSGFLKGGLVDRRNVSLYQLAAVACIRDLYGVMTIHNHCRTYTPYTTPPILTAAVPGCERLPALLIQDPVFNDLDKALLTSLGMTVLDHPEAFDLEIIPRSTLLYCPGAEKVHLELLLSRPEIRPTIVIGGPLENADSEGLDEFTRSREESVSIPKFEPCEHAFWGSKVYCA